MGQCTSRKAAGAYAATTVYQNRPMARPNQNEQQGQDEYKDSSKRSSGSFTRGVTTSFGFKRRPSTAIPVLIDNSPNNKQNTDTIDNNGNDDSLDSLETTAPYPPGRSTPRLAPPKKEASASRITRFGFRQSNRATQVETQVPTENKNNNVEKPRKTVSITLQAPKVKQIQKPTESTRHKTAKTAIPQPQSNIPAKFTFHSTQLPRPQLPVRVLESKNAKTVANINRKVSTVSQRSEECSSSKEGSVTEDSGVGSHTSGTNGNLTGDTDTLHGVELMDSSPTFGARRNRNIRSRNLEFIVSSKTFDVRDLDDSLEDGVVTEVDVIPLPRLPSVFGNNSTDTRNAGMYGGNNLSSGIVRERTLEYERQLDMNRRKISVTSSEGFSDDYGEEEKSFRDRSCTEKSGLSSTRLFSPANTFRDTRISTRLDKDASPGSSDDQDWEQGGEAMAEVYSINFSSSDESKDKEISPIPLRLPNRSTHLDMTSSQMSSSGTLPKDNFKSVLLKLESPKYSNAPENRTVLPSEDSKLFTRSQMSSSGSSMSTSSGAIPKTMLLPLEPRMSSMNSSISSPKESLKSVLLSIEDPKFAAVAAASSGTLLDDETSPVDSLISSYTESEEIVSKQKNKCCKSPSTDSKDINEKSPLSPASPGTPTNTSLSLSEGRDFLIDDEIADQPALMFNETLTSLDRCDSQRMYDIDRLNSEHQNISDSVATLVDSTPKTFRKGQRSCEGSPAPVRAKHPLLSRTASIDTLSPCESIASDDLMMDFDQSQSSGIDDSTDRFLLNESGALHSLDEATIRSELLHQDSVVAREWSSLLGTHSNKEFPAYNTVRTNNFIRSRTTTPSSVPDSPRSLDRVRGFNSPHLRSARTTHGSPAAYDSDDSLRMTHGSMVNDIVGIKTMLLKLKRVLQETDGDTLMRNEPLNPFDNQVNLKNGFCNRLSNNEQSDVDSIECESDLNHSSTMEMVELRRQIEFLQSQLEDKDRTVHRLQNQVTKYTLDAHIRSGFDREHETCNAATQTDRVRPMSAGPSLLQSMPTDGNMGPLVSANETTQRSRPQSMVETHSRTPPPLKLWRKPGEPPPPSRYAQQNSSLPRRARSRSRPTPS